MRRSNRFWRRAVACCAGLSVGVAAAAEPAPPPPAVAAAAAPCPPQGDVEVMPIDLPTALRLVNASNPTVALARERVAEAYAHLREAEVFWLPNLQMGPAYNRHDGRIQNAHGDIFDTSKSNLFAGGGAALSFQTSDALFAPLIARRLVDAQAAAARAVTNDVQLDVALTYLDLLRVYGQMGINADRLRRAKEVLDSAEAARKTELDKTTADVTRARAEYALRQRERIDLEGDAAVVSARLAQLLLLQPTVDLRPAEPAIVPVTLVPVEGPIDDLIATGLLNRPELAEGRALVEAALARWRQARVGPFIPRLDVSYFAGTYGGGRNEFVGDFGGRGDGTAQAVWEFHNLGAGDVARARARRSQYNQANLHVVEVQAQVAAEVTAAAKQARARERTLAAAQKSVSEALETYRRLRAAGFGLLGRNKVYESLEPLTAERVLAEARTAYLTEVIDYNRAQFRLYAAMGRPPQCALPGATAQSLEVPVVPPRPASPDTGAAPPAAPR